MQFQTEALFEFVVFHQVDGPSAAARHELDDGEDSERLLALALAKELVSTIEASPEPHAALDLVDGPARRPRSPTSARVEEEIDGALEQLVAGGLFMLCYPSGFVKHKRFFFVEPGSGDFIWCKPEAKPEPWPPVWAKTAFEAQRSEAIVKALDGVSHKREHIVGVSPRAPMVWPADCARAFIVTTDSTQLVLVASDEATKDVFVMGMYELLDREVRI